MADGAPIQWDYKDDSLHKLHGLLPPRNLSTVALGRKHAFNVPFCKTKINE